MEQGTLKVCKTCKWYYSAIKAKTCKEMGRSPGDSCDQWTPRDESFHKALDELPEDGVVKAINSKAEKVLVPLQDYEGRLKGIAKALQNMDLKKTHALEDYVRALNSYRMELLEIRVDLLFMGTSFESLWSQGQAYLLNFPTIFLLKSEGQRKVAIQNLLGPFWAAYETWKATKAATDAVIETLDKIYFSIKMLLDRERPSEDVFD